MLRVIKRLRNVSLWTRAVEHSARSNWIEALGLLARIDRQNLGHLKKDYSLFAAYNYLRVADHDRCREAVAEALNILDQLQRLNAAEKAYRKKYAEFVVANLLGSHASNGISYDEVDLCKVDSRTKQLFPLRLHPGWVEP